MIPSCVSESAVLIVGFRNASDVSNCLSALSKTSTDTPFDVFICENGGAPAYRKLVRDLTGVDGPCGPNSSNEDGADQIGFVEVECLDLRGDPHVCGLDAPRKISVTLAVSMPGFARFWISRDGRALGS